MIKGIAAALGLKWNLAARVRGLTLSVHGVSLLFLSVAVGVVVLTLALAVFADLLVFSFVVAVPKASKVFGTFFESPCYPDGARRYSRLRSLVRASQPRLQGRATRTMRTRKKKKS